MDIEEMGELRKLLAGYKKMLNDAEAAKGNATPVTLGRAHYTSFLDYVRRLPIQLVPPTAPTIPDQEDKWSIHNARRFDGSDTECSTQDDLETDEEDPEDKENTRKEEIEDTDEDPLDPEKVHEELLDKNKKFKNRDEIDRYFRAWKKSKWYQENVGLIGTSAKLSKNPKITETNCQTRSLMIVLEQMRAQINDLPDVEDKYANRKKGPSSDLVEYKKIGQTVSTTQQILVELEESWAQTDTLQYTDL